jgi:hypothetical protein
VSISSPLQHTQSDHDKHGSHSIEPIVVGHFALSLSQAVENRVRIDCCVLACDGRSVEFSRARSVSVKLRFLPRKLSVRMDVALLLHVKRALLIGCVRGYIFRSLDLETCNFHHLDS